MSTIIAGRFERADGGGRALTALEAAGFSTRPNLASSSSCRRGCTMCTARRAIPMRPPGRITPDTGAIAGATAGGGVGVLAGIATAPFLGPGAAIAGAAFGAYVGSLAGALDQTSHPTQKTSDPTAPAEEAPPRKVGRAGGGRIGSADERTDAVGVLRPHGAHDVELAEGTITGGDWADFDPLQPLVPVDRAIERSL